MQSNGNILHDTNLFVRYSLGFLALYELSIYKTLNQLKCPRT